MIHYNSLNVKLSNSQLNKLKLGINNEAEVTLNLSWNMIGDYDNKIDFPHKLLLTDRQVLRLRKVFLGLLLKTGLPLMKDILNWLKAFLYN